MDRNMDIVSTREKYVNWCEQSNKHQKASQLKEKTNKTKTFLFVSFNNEE
jgi:hypothetical protein